MELSNTLMSDYREFREQAEVIADCRLASCSKIQQQSKTISLTNNFFLRYRFSIRSEDRHVMSVISKNLIDNCNH